MMSSLSELEVKHLANVTFEQLYSTHHRAFKDYPFQWSPEALKRTMQRRGYVPDLSFGLFHNNELVSFTMNGIGLFNGQQTAYDMGTATLEDYRGRGLASKVFEWAIHTLKHAGVKQYLLEVLEENDTAVSVYERQGFKVTRKFDCFRENMSALALTDVPAIPDVTFKRIGLDALEQMKQMCDFTPSWQNSFDALHRSPDDFVTMGAFYEGALAGFGVIEPDSGDVPLLAVTKDMRRKGLGRALLAELCRANQATVLKVVNIEQNQDAALGFIKACGISKIVSQFEMIKEL